MWSLYSEDDFPGLCSWTVSEACHGTTPPRGVGGKALGPCEVGSHMGLHLAPEGVAVRGEWASAAPRQPALVETPRVPDRPGHWDGSPVVWDSQRRGSAADFSEVWSACSLKARRVWEGMDGATHAAGPEPRLLKGEVVYSVYCQVSGWGVDADV